MEKISLVLNNTHSVGLGDNLCLISALAKLPPPVELYVNNNHKTFDRLTHYAKIFRISKSQLEILPTEEEGDFNNVGWPVKLFTDYFKPGYVSVNGQSIKLTKTLEKKCIALVTSFDPDPTGNNEWPWSRCRPLSYWTKIFEWAKSNGYEVITLDNPFFSLEDKVEILAKYCKAMISYEGGMAHLAHMMDLPCFLLDWKHPSPSTDLSGMHCEFVHRSNSVYILRTDDELLSWSGDYFNHMISELHAGKTNNRLVTGEVKLEFQGPGIQGNIYMCDAQGNRWFEASGLFGNRKVGQVLNQYYGPK